MENSLYLLLGFAKAAEKYMAENKGKSLNGIENIDLPNLEKYLTDSIGSFDSDEQDKSSKLGELVFSQFIKEKNNANKKNVIDELGQIFDVDFDSEINEEKQAKLKIDDLLAGYETEDIEEEKTETVQEEKVETVQVKDEEENIDYEEVINNIIGIKEDNEDKQEETTGDIFHVVTKPEPQEEVHDAPKSEEVATTLVEIANDNIGEFETIEETIDEDEQIVEEIKDAFDDLKEEDNDSEEIVIEQEENDFGIDENDEILMAIRKAAGFDTQEKEENEMPVFQPAPDELDSLFEEVEGNSNQDTQEEKETYEEYTPLTPEDYLKTLSGLINYGQFEENAEEEVVKEDEEPIREAHYILNPLIDEEIQEEHFVVSDEEDEKVEEEIIQEEIVEEVSQEEPVQEEETLIEQEYVYPTSEELALHFIENPGLDVVFNGDDIIYSSYDEQEVQEETASKDEEVVVEEVEEIVQEETLEENKEVDEETSNVQEEVVLDENEQYVDDLLKGYEFTNSKVDEILDAREEVYKVISKMYPYLNYAFIKSAYDLKDSIADEYKENEKIVILHRAIFKELEDLRKYAELMMNHMYQVNVDEHQMMVDTLKSYVNVDGLILNSIFEVANQINLLNGEYEGYCVLTDKED